MAKIIFTKLCKCYLKQHIQRSMLLNNIAVCIIMQGFLSFSSAKSTVSYSLFAPSFIPLGICTDGNGNVFVSSVDENNPFQNLLTKYSPEGVIIHQEAIMLFGYLEYDPVLNKIWLLDKQQFYLVDPDNLTISSYLDISKLNVDISNIYDAGTGTIFNMYINTATAFYQDFDLYRKDNQLYIIIAGFHQAWHFVLRIIVNNDNVQSAKVTITSGSSLSPLDNVPHGIAVNSYGLVLTTLGWTGKVANIDRGIVFGADFPEDNSYPPSYLFDEYQAFSSRGMTCDKNNNFYIATGCCGSGAAGGGASSIIYIPSSLEKTYSYSFESLFADPRDITISADNKMAYISDSNIDYFADDDAIWTMQNISTSTKDIFSTASEYALSQNYPNPFNPSTKINYTISCLTSKTGKEHVILKVYDILSKEIATLVNEYKSAGEYEVVWNAKNISSGVYFYQIQAGKFIKVRKMLLIK